MSLAVDRRAGFGDVVATSKYFSYGTAKAVQAFGLARADECGDGWYGRSARKHGLVTEGDLDAMRRAWLEWLKSSDAYVAFPWCRALGWKPS
jgi:hypothetical protein